MTEAPVETITVTVIPYALWEEDDIWIAQCLSHDIAAQGPTAFGAVCRLEATIEVEHSFAMAMNRIPLTSFPAPSDDAFPENFLLGMLCLTFDQPEVAA